MNTTAKITRESLNYVMDFDHVIQVHADGTVTDGPADVWAPEVTYSEGDDPRKPHIDSQRGYKWQLLTGYSGQESYAGPIMHDSEYIGGRMADDILTTPGLYVAVVVTDPNASEEDREAGADVAGWAVAYLPARREVPADFPVKVLTDGEPATDRVTCGECGRSWDDAIVTGMTPAPSARCPFEYFH